MELRDGLGRRFNYLRLSITDACNFRCAYCLPGGWCPAPGADAPLSIDEIRRLVVAFATLGVEKVRLTGGEPTLRRDLAEIVAAISGVPGIRRVGITTNGFGLSRLAPALRDAGLAFVNVSVDSLDPERFRAVTGKPLLERVLRGVEGALAAGFGTVKVNAVLLRGLDRAEFDRFVEWTERRPIAVRFIELMPTGCDSRFFAAHHVPVAWVAAELERRGWFARDRAPTDGPAIEYMRAGHAGSVGYIAPSTAGFCAACNRLRVSSRGALKLCLFGDRDVSLRSWLASDAHAGDLAGVLARLVQSKPAAHRLGAGCHGTTRSLAAIGG
ncbi:GTP 3',8-cyclase MoaA [Anaeromyxobacter sp. PSR-1]|uniref:GTP 3',8-cyclase MoaA n=1 Tax=Anaeromyxobacter sp. PSR-1 TaxID=1300915 RepID=UPI0005E18B0A|nr:GTP 3',8-cyclase MoaA [Anaeromyxobacter sp. PSR-1]GAO01465.1 cyclic pyranopterin monophosphate synthase [Anaeromyxobacter sp. PSR-1]